MRKYFVKMFKNSTQHAFSIWKEVFVREASFNISRAEDFAVKDTTDKLNDLRGDNDKLRIKVAKLQEQL